MIKQQKPWKLNLLKRSVALLLCAVLTISITPTMTKAQSIKELEQELSQLKTEQENIKKKQQQNKRDLTEQEAKKQTYQQEITLVEKQLTTYNKKIQKISSQIDDTNLEIKEKTKQIEQQTQTITEKLIEIEETNELFKQRLDAMYIAQSSNSYLSLLLGASSFSAFLSASETIQGISKYDQDLLRLLDAQHKELEQLKLALEQQKEELEQQKIRLTENKNDLSATKKTFEEKAFELQELVAKLDYVFLKLEEINGELKLSYEQNLAEVEYTQEEKKRQEEIARKAREAYEKQKRIEEENRIKNGLSSAPVNGSGYLRPIPQGVGYVSSGYGMRWGRLHAGTDFAAPSGTPIYATLDGVVVDVNYFNGAARSGMNAYGNMVRLYHPSTGTYSRYGHASALFVSTGDEVKQGQTIATVGTTGFSTGNHLHFEISTGVANSTRVNPLPYVN